MKAFKNLFHWKWVIASKSGAERKIDTALMWGNGISAAVIGVILLLELLVIFSGHPYPFYKAIISAAFLYVNASFAYSIHENRKVEDQENENE